ncbi:hypothetical protein A3Q56_04232 [Intoshia linei]|uniref:F-box domain-containing protein n=1 Tax=Intoshia linei TaxID=1819745 RepID=A0A177B195_9BILA|nr:hypothetical protein A3Q56_04232 [Intoshia linei]
MQSSYLQRLPYDILERVIIYLEPIDVYNLFLLMKIEIDAIWKRINLKLWPLVTIQSKISNYRSACLYMYGIVDIFNNKPEKAIEMMKNKFGLQYANDIDLVMNIDGICINRLRRYLFNRYFNIENSQNMYTTYQSRDGDIYIRNILQNLTFRKVFIIDAFRHSVKFCLLSRNLIRIFSEIYTTSNPEFRWKHDIKTFLISGVLLAHDMNLSDTQFPKINKEKFVQLLIVNHGEDYKEMIIQIYDNIKEKGLFQKNCKHIPSKFVQENSECIIHMETKMQII